MTQAIAGDSVKIHYTGTLDDGSEFDSSAGREPLTFVLGNGQVIPGFDAAVTGMEVGESKSVTIPPAEAYGFGGHPLAGQALTFAIELLEVN